MTKKPKKLQKLKKLAFVLIMAMALSTMILILFLSYLIRTGDFQRYLIAQFERRTQLKVALGQAGIGWDGAVGITFRDFALFKNPNSRPLFTAEKVLVRISLLPLIRGQVILSEIRFRRPTIRVSGRTDKGFSPLGFVVGLLSKKSDETAFAVDLRKVRIRGGEIQIFQKGPARKSALLRISEIDLDLRRIGTTGFRTWDGEKFGSGAKLDGNLALRVNFRANVEKNKAAAKVWASGKMLLPVELSEFQGFVWDMELGSDRLPSRLLSQLTPPNLISFLQAHPSTEVPNGKIPITGKIASEAPQLHIHPDFRPRTSLLCRSDF